MYQEMERVGSERDRKREMDRYRNKNGWTYGLMDGLVDRWMKGWMHGLIHRQILVGKEAQQELFLTNRAKGEFFKLVINKLNIPPCLLTEIGSRRNRRNARNRSSKVPV